MLDMVHSFADAEDHARSDSGRTWAWRPRNSTRNFWPGWTSDVGKTVGKFRQMAQSSLKALVEAAENKDYDEVTARQGEIVRSMYPEYVYPANAYEFLAEADIWPRATSRRPRDADRLRKNWRAQSRCARSNSHRWRRSSATRRMRPPPSTGSTTSIPKDEDLHRQLGDLWLAQKNYRGRDPRIPGGDRDAAAGQGLRAIQSGPSLFRRRPERQGRGARAGVAGSGARLPARSKIIACNCKDSKTKGNEPDGLPSHSSIRIPRN